MICTVAGIVLGVIVGLYALFELHYFLRMCLCVITARFFKKRMHILDPTAVVGKRYWSLSKLLYWRIFIIAIHMTFFLILIHCIKHYTLYYKITHSLYDFLSSLVIQLCIGQSSYISCLRGYSK